MVEFSPISGDKKIHDLTALQNDSLPAPSLELPKHKGPNSSARIDAHNVAKALDKNGILKETTPEADDIVLKAMILSMAIGAQKQL